jgi:DNA repair exonuclease SbcCD ATPase subunit
LLNFSKVIINSKKQLFKGEQLPFIYVYNITELMDINPFSAPEPKPDTFESDVKLLNTNITGSFEKMAIMKGQLSGLREKLHESLDKITTWAKGNTHLETRISDLETSLNKLNTEKTLLNNKSSIDLEEISKLNSQIEECNQEKSNLEKKLTESTGRLTIIQERVKSWKKMFDDNTDAVFNANEVGGIVDIINKITGLTGQTGQTGQGKKCKACRKVRCACIHRRKRKTAFRKKGRGKSSRKKTKLSKKKAKLSRKKTRRTKTLKKR